MNYTDDSGAAHRLLANALCKKGYTIETQNERPHLSATFISPRGAKWTTPAPRVQYPFISRATHDLFDDKASAYSFVEAAGVPVPATLYINDPTSLNADSLDSFINKYAPLAVKPNNSSSSKGLALDIRNRNELTDAIQSAHHVKRSEVLVQQQVDGDEVRFIVLRGKVVAALSRQTPRVIGDGRKTVQELLEEENRARQALNLPFVKYPQLTPKIIDAAFFSRTDVLKEGEVLQLSRATKVKNGCSVFEILRNIHGSYVQKVESLIQDIEADFFVVDFLVKDYTQQAASDNHWFLEFNVSPALWLCYSCRDGRQFDIVPLVARLIDETLHSA